MVTVLALASCSEKQANNQSGVEGGAPIENAESLIALNNRGVGLMGKFDYEAARSCFEQALVIDPRNADLLVNLAIATLNRQREGDEDRALALLDEALKADPNCIRAVYCQGLLRLYLQSPELAQPCFERVDTDNLDDAYVSYFLGQSLAQQRKYADALVAFQGAILFDDKLRSAYYAASQAYRAVGADDAAAKMLAEFQSLERNPQARLAEFKYSRMGPKAMAKAFDPPGAAPTIAARPDGPIFLPTEPLLTNGDQFKWKAQAAAGDDRAISITAVDIEHDGDIDVFIANALTGDDGLRNAVCINDSTGKFALDPSHPLANIADVNAALWGDIDNDGLTDVYLCRRGPNMLWRQLPSPLGRGAGGEGKAGTNRDTNAADASSSTVPSPLTPLPKGEGNFAHWTDATAATQTGNGEFDSVDGALFDADHDGDLDIFVINANGPNELLNNNLDGTFKPIADEAGMAGAGTGSRQVLPVDLDNDRDLDIIVINNQPPHDVWINERAWQYSEMPDADWIRNASIGRILARDLDADGSPELIVGQKREVLVWAFNPVRGWTSQRMTKQFDDFEVSEQAANTRSMFIADLIGDGSHRLIYTNSKGAWSERDLLDNERGQSSTFEPVATGLAFVTQAWDGTTGLIAAHPNQPPTIWRPGPGRFPFASVSFTGKQVTSDNKQIRSNASGIGTHFAARIGSRWVAGHTLRQSSGPGQSLQPIAIGLGGAAKIDFLSINWSDGVFQTELDLEAGKHHVIEETQRQLSSCPVLFAWDGERYRFITDILGVAGIGYMIAPGPPSQYGEPRPWENVLLPEGSMQPRDGEFVLKLGEPMEEACYLDSAKLVAYDLPPGWSMSLDERMKVAGGPEPTGEAMFYREASLRVPTRAIDAIGRDVRANVIASDLTAPPVGEVDERFIGLLDAEQILTLTFESQGRNEADLSRRIRAHALLIDGWVEYPYSQTMFASSQAGATYHAPTLEMRNADGDWRVVYDQFGYPAGMPRQMALPLPSDLDFSDEIELRIRTNQEIYFDRIAIVEIEECPEAKRFELPLTQATLADVGFAFRTTGPQGQPMYDYERRAPLWDTRHQRGWYTAFGRIDELVSTHDDAVAIFGPGEEIELRFDAKALPELKHDWTRRFVLESRGWCKDMDLYTKDGDTLEPLPRSDAPFDESHRDELHRRFNTRFMSGH